MLLAAPGINNAIPQKWTLMGVSANPRLSHETDQRQTIGILGQMARKFRERATG